MFFQSSSVQFSKKKLIIIFPNIIFWSPRKPRPFFVFRQKKKIKLTFISIFDKIIHFNCFSHFICWYNKITMFSLITRSCQTIHSSFKILKKKVIQKFVIKKKLTLFRRSFLIFSSFLCFSFDHFFTIKSISFSSFFHSFHLIKKPYHFRPKKTQHFFGIFW